ncbi:MAG TPA: sialidase family protein [Candidatus Dormibacteraeota bacterium]|nr:sialidase family protein [Candidatus Dormibacteraeota bacterium]
MRRYQIAAIAIVATVSVAGVSAQEAVKPGKVGQTAVADKKAARVPQAFQNFRIRPSAPLRFLASGEGRGYLEAVDHPLAQYLSTAFGGKVEQAIAPEPQLAEEPLTNESVQPELTATAPVTSCKANLGKRFNLEPRANAVPQNQGSADFIINGIAPNNDLILQVANDWRGNLTSGVRWDQSVSGYYAHRSSVGDCSVQFEGGFPSFLFQGNTEMGVGDAVVVADPARNAFFVADLRFGPIIGVALFRASAATLSNPASCPAGTHTEAQAESCWKVTAPALLFPQPQTDYAGDQPRLAVDERSAGKGAGDVYVVETEFDFNAQTNRIYLVACTNLLKCGKTLLISGPDVASGYPYVQVRTDGMITISYVEVNSNGSDSVRFVTCRPAGAPLSPVCGAANTVTTILRPVTFTGGNGQLVNMNFPLAATYPKHANRFEAAGKFTIFLVYEDCKDVYSQGHGNPDVCMNAEVRITHSTDNGASWSAPASLDTTDGHHFFPGISTDESRGTVNVVYYSTEGDAFRHNVRVVLNQIAAHSTAPGAAQLITTTFEPSDRDPGNLGAFLTDGFVGVIARGTGMPGASRLYISFDSTSSNGTYSGQPLSEQNNHLRLFTF